MAIDAKAILAEFSGEQAAIAKRCIARTLRALHKAKRIRKRRVLARFNRWLKGIRKGLGVKASTPCVYAPEDSRIGARSTWIATFGAIPKDMLVCHRCDDSWCVNISHLFLGTTSDNGLDRSLKRRCKGAADESRMRKDARRKAHTEIVRDGRQWIRDAIANAGALPFCWLLRIRDALNAALAQKENS